ncbi:MAG TPA: hypothetical protein VGO43_00395 [Pyrinomonadaceae bacterium]|jgi:hypothetical protein|nr:hypothetical protein [Pyrinomonadaceae bacterium]
MKNGTSKKPKKILIVTAALVVGMLVPYISRIPLAVIRGNPLIWSYMSTGADVLRWNGIHIISLIPMAIFGLIYIYGKLSWGFYASIVGHFGITSFIYYNFGEKYGLDDFLGCIFFPPMIAFVAGACGAVAFVAELIVQRITARTTNEIA